MQLNICHDKWNTNCSIDLLLYIYIEIYIVQKYILELYWFQNPVEDSIMRKLTERLSPVHLEVINESHMHNVPKGKNLIKISIRLIIPADTQMVRWIFTSQITKLGWLESSHPSVHTCTQAVCKQMNFKHVSVNCKPVQL